MMLFDQTIVIENPGEEIGFDSLGNPILGPPTSTESPAWYEERVSTEALDARDQKVWGYWVYTPLSEPLKENSKVFIENVPYHVVGKPGRQPGGFVVEGYIHAAVERTTG